VAFNRCAAATRKKIKRRSFAFKLLHPYLLASKSHIFCLFVFESRPLFSFADIPDLEENEECNETEEAGTGKA